MAKIIVDTATLKQMISDAVIEAMRMAHNFNKTAGHEHPPGSYMSRCQQALENAQHKKDKKNLRRQQ